MSLTSFVDTMELLLSLEKKRVAVWEKELAGLPEGNLHLVNRGNKTYFQLTIGDHRQGISNDIDLIYRLARKRYLQLLLQDRQEVVREDAVATSFVLSRASANRNKQARDKRMARIHQLLHRYGKAGLKVLRITCSEEQYRWVLAKYRRNTMNPEELKYETYSGIKVRSKSEQSIGNALEVRGIPYRYEMEISLDVGWMEDINRPDGGTYKHYYPDFVIPTATGELIFWEHLGRVHEKKYRDHNMEKISAYRQSGACDDAHLILTFEKDMEELGKLKELITTRILPYVSAYGVVA